MKNRRNLIIFFLGCVVGGIIYLLVSLLPILNWKGGFILIDYIVYLLVILMISWDLVSIFKVLSGKYTSIFVRYFTVASIFPDQLKNLSENKEKEKKFKSLVISNEMLHILITLFLLGGSLSNRIPNIVWICLFSYHAISMVIRYITRKLLESDS